MVRLSWITLMSQQPETQLGSWLSNSPKNLLGKPWTLPGCGREGQTVRCVVILPCITPCRSSEM